MAEKRKEKKKKETTKISAALLSNDEDEDQKLQPLVLTSIGHILADKHLCLREKREQGSRV